MPGMSVLLFLVACGQQVTLQPGLDGCENYNFTDPQDPTLEWEAAADGTGRVWRTNVLMEQTGMVFEPEIVVEGDTVSLYEVWTGGEGEPQFCYAPYLALTGIQTQVQVRWYLAVGETVPFETVNVEAP